MGDKTGDPVQAGENSDARPARGPWVLLVLAGLPVLIYACCLLVLSRNAAQPLSTVVCFDPVRFTGLGAGERAVSLMAAAGACGFLFAVPLWLGLMVCRRWSAGHSLAHNRGFPEPQPRPPEQAAAGVWSLALNSAGLMAVCLVLRESVGLSRPSFVAGWGLWCVGLAVLAWRAGAWPSSSRELWTGWGPGLVVAAGTVAAGVGLFWQDQFLQCFNGDGTESAELARSLRGHFLPTWEIEPIDRFGATIVNPALVNSYWTFALGLLLGENEFAARLPYWVYWFGIVLVSCSIQRRLGRSGLGAWLAVSLGALLSATWYTFYAGYDPYLADLANPGVPDALFTLCVLLACDCLLRGSVAGWVCGMVLASLVLYAGPVMFVVSAAAAFVWRPVERPRVVRGTLAGAAVLVLIAALYLLWGWIDGLLAGWWVTLQSEYVNDYFAPMPRLQSGALYAGYFLLGCGGIPALGLGTAFRASAWQRTVATLIIAYLLIILGSAAKNLHYLGPLLPLTILLWTVRPGIRRPGTISLGSAAATVSLCVAIALCWPRLRPIFTLTRELGTQTTWQTASYEEACRWADLAVIYDMRITSWFVGPHTWVGYSHLEPQPMARRPLLVTMDERPPPGYAVRGRAATGLKICLDLRQPQWLEWAASRSPAIGPERFPWILREVAPRPQPRLRLELAR